jgi:hypothetical protein
MLEIGNAIYWVIETYFVMQSVVVLSVILLSVVAALGLRLCWTNVSSLSNV